MRLYFLGDFALPLGGLGFFFALVVVANIFFGAASRRRSGSTSLRVSSVMADEVAPMQSPLEQHPDYVKALGMISVEISNVEIELGFMLAALLGIHHKLGHVIYLTPQSFMGRLQIIENVAALSLGPDCEGLKAANAIFKRVKARIGNRNTSMHSAWGVWAKDRTVVTRRSVPFLESNPAKRVDLNELTEEVNKLRHIADDIRAETAALKASRAAAVALFSKRNKPKPRARKAKLKRSNPKSEAP